MCGQVIVDIQEEFDRTRYVVHALEEIFSWKRLNFSVMLVESFLDR